MEIDDGDKANPCPCCKQCTDCTTEFEKIVDLVNAGLVIYRRTTKSEDVKQDNGTVLSASKTTEDVFILHNTKNSIITSREYLPELEKREIACARCRKIMEHALKLLQKVPAINKYDIAGICDHCRLKEHTCNDCDEAVKKFFLNKGEIYKENTKKSIKEWLSKIKNVINDSFVGKKETGRAPMRSKSELRIVQLCRRESRAEREPHIRDLLYDLQKPGSARTLPIIEGKKQIDVLIDHPQLKTVDRPLTLDLSGRNLNKDQLSFSPKDLDGRDYLMDDILPAGYSARYTHDDENYNQKTVDEQYVEKEKYQKHDRGQAFNEKKLQAETPDVIKISTSGGIAKTDTLHKEDSFSVPQEIRKKLIRHKSSSEINSKEKDTEREKIQIVKDTKNKDKPATTISAKQSKTKDMKQKSGPEEPEFKQKASKIKSKEPIHKPNDANEPKSEPRPKSTPEKSKTEMTNRKSVPKIPKSVLEEPIPLAKELKFVQKETKSGTKESKFETKDSKSATIKPKSVTKEPKSATTEIKSTRKASKSETKEPKSVLTDQKVTKNALEVEHEADRERTQKKIQGKENSKLNKDDDEEKKTDKQKVVNPDKNEDQNRKQQENRVKEKAINAEKLTGKEKIDQEKYEKENTLKTEKEKKEREKQDKENHSKSEKNREQEKKERDRELDKIDKKGATLNTDKASNQKEENLVKRKGKEKEGRKDDIDMKINQEYAPGEKKNVLGVADVEESKLPSKEQRPQDSQIQKKNGQNLEEHNMALNKIKLQQDDPNTPVSQIKGKTDLKQSTEKELPEPKINLLKDDSMKKAKEENALNRKIVQAAKEAAALEKASNKKKLVDDKTDKKHLDITKIKMLKSSSDDLILKLVRLKQEGKQFKGRLSKIMSTYDIKTHHDHHGIKKNGRCPMCVNSDLEFDYEKEKKKGFELFEIVRGQKICKFKSQFTDKNVDEEVSPLLYKSKYDEPAIEIIKTAELPSTIIDEKKSPPQSGKSGKILVEPEGKGVIRYALSDRTFIEKGWTVLPTEKVVRKMNVYRMRPAQPEFDWFKRNKNKGVMQYESGERLAEFGDDGRGRWYYRNGRMALDYYDAEESNAQQRYVIYSNGEPDERGRSRPYTVLATFDYLGNGVVFDHGGKIRLKYNQTEGVVLDRNIGPVTHWKWHTLNDPPVLQQVMIDTQMTHKDPEILKMGKNNDPRLTERPIDDEMLAIEFDNFVKEKSKKITQSFKPFQIKMKALKINEHFSLKVLDQATVYLIYRDGTTNLKLNMGMILNHKEIVDTDTAELGEVANSLEKFPARTDSLAGLQKSVAYAERFERTRTERDRRLRPPNTSISTNKLSAAVSRPIRHPLRTVHSSTTTTETTGCFFKCSLKPVSNNVYYDARLNL